MIREINILDAKDIQEICKDELGYNVDIKTVKKQIEKLSVAQADDRHATQVVPRKLCPGKGIPTLG